MTRLTLFDYHALNPDDSAFVQKRTGEIKHLVKRTAQDIIEIGGKLIEVKSLLPHGKFSEWLKEEFSWSQDTAERLMNVAKWSMQNPQIAEYDFDRSAFYLLASPSTPDAARVEALERAEAGETLTHSKAKVIRQAHTEPAINDAMPAFDRGASDLSVELKAIAPTTVDDDPPSEIQWRK